MDSTEESEGQEEGGTDGTGNSETVSDSYQWLALIDSVSETTRETWAAVWNMGIYEFFNIVAYRNEKLDRQKAEIQKWKRNN